VLFYNQLDVIQQASARLCAQVNKTTGGGAVSYSIGFAQLDALVRPLIDACKAAVRFLPHLKTGTSLDDNDLLFAHKVAELTEGWERLKE
jgi:hypothetical protein